MREARLDCSSCNPGILTDHRVVYIPTSWCKSNTHSLSTLTNPPRIHLCTVFGCIKKGTYPDHRKGWGYCTLSWPTDNCSIMSSFDTDIDTSDASTVGQTDPTEDRKPCHLKRSWGTAGKFWGRKDSKAHLSIYLKKRSTTVTSMDSSVRWPGLSRLPDLVETGTKLWRSLVRVLQSLSKERTVLCHIHAVCVTGLTHDRGLINILSLL